MKKIGSLNLFFQHNKDTLPLFPSENIPDFLPSLIFLCDVGTGRILYGNRKFFAYEGRHSRRLQESPKALKSFIQSEDYARFEKLLHANCKAKGSQEMHSTQGLPDAISSTTSRKRA